MVLGRFVQSAVGHEEWTAGQLVYPIFLLGLQCGPGVRSQMCVLSLGMNVTKDAGAGSLFCSAWVQCPLPLSREPAMRSLSAPFMLTTSVKC